MKLFTNALVTGTAAAILFFTGTGSAHADKGGPKGGPSGGSAKVGSGNAGSMKSSQGSGQASKQGNYAQHQGSKMPHQNFKKDFYCGNTWNKGCYPSNYNYGYNFCGYNFGCSSYPWYNRCYTPTYEYCYTPQVFYTYQPRVITTTRVIEVIQPAPVVETVTTTATTTAVKPPCHEAGFVNPVPRP